MTAEKKRNVVKKRSTTAAYIETRYAQKNYNQGPPPNNLKALAMDNRWARLVVLGLTDPHLLEGGERCENGTTDPDGVLSLRRGDNLDLHCAGCQGGNFLLHAIGNTGVHGRTARQDSVGVQVLTDINVALHDRVVGGFMDTARFHTDEAGLEEGLRATESFVTDGDDLTVGKFVALFQGR